MITSILKEDQKPVLSWEGSDFDEAWDDFCYEVSYLMQKRDKRSKMWYVEVENFGWSQTNGHTIIETTDAHELLNKVLPKTQNTFYIYVVDRDILIQNFHHDSNTGKEWYKISPLTKKEAQYA